MSDDTLELPDDLLADLFALAPEFRSHYPAPPDRTPGNPLEEQQGLLDNIAFYFSLLNFRSWLVTEEALLGLDGETVLLNSGHLTYLVWLDTLFPDTEPYPAPQ
jgi:hypothetical protein